MKKRKREKVRKLKETEFRKIRRITDREVGVKKSTVEERRSVKIRENNRFKKRAHDILKYQV